MSGFNFKYDRSCRCIREWVNNAWVIPQCVCNPLQYSFNFFTAIGKFWTMITNIILIYWNILVLWIDLRIWNIYLHLANLPKTELIQSLIWNVCCLYQYYTSLWGIQYLQCFQAHAHSITENTTLRMDKLLL